MVVHTSSEHAKNEAAMTGLAPPFGHPLTTVLCFYGGLGFFHVQALVVACSTLQPLQAVSEQLNPVLSPRLSSKG